MTAIESRWRDALFAAILPGSEHRPGFDSIATDGFWLQFGRTAPFLVRFGFRFAVFALSWLPLLRYGRPFHRLPPTHQDEYLNQVAASRSYLLRQLITVVKLIACFAAFQDPRVQASVRGAR